MKQTIKLSESELKRVIVESVKRVLKESGNTKRGSYLMGRAGKRNLVRGDISNFIDKRDKASNKDAFNQGMEGFNTSIIVRITAMGITSLHLFSGFTPRI